MSLAIDSVKNTFQFVRRFPITFVFYAIFYSITYAGLILSISSIFHIMDWGASLGLGLPLMVFGTNVYVSAALVVLGAAFIILSSLVTAGGFPLIVKQAVERKKVDLVGTIGESFWNIKRTFLTSLLTGAITIVAAIPLLIGLLLLSFWFLTFVPSVFVGEPASAPSPLLPITGGVLMIIGVITSTIITTRLWLTFPLLMIEKLGVVKSVKRSWALTKGKILSIFSALFIFGLIFGILNAIINTVVELSLGATATQVWEFVYALIAGTFIGVLSTSYYYTMKTKQK